MTNVVDITTREENLELYLIELAFAAFNKHFKRDPITCGLGPSTSQRTVKLARAAEPHLQPIFEALQELSLSWG